MKKIILFISLLFFLTINSMQSSGNIIDQIVCALEADNQSEAEELLTHFWGVTVQMSLLEQIDNYLDLVLKIIHYQDCVANFCKSIVNCYSLLDDQDKAKAIEQIQKLIEPLIDSQNLQALSHLIVIFSDNQASESYQVMEFSIKELLAKKSNLINYDASESSNEMVDENLVIQDTQESCAYGELILNLPEELWFIIFEYLLLIQKLYLNRKIFM